MPRTTTAVMVRTTLCEQRAPQNLGLAMERVEYPGTDRAYDEQTSSAASSASTDSVHRGLPGWVFGPYAPKPRSGL